MSSSDWKRAAVFISIVLVGCSVLTEDERIQACCQACDAVGSKPWKLRDYGRWFSCSCDDGEYFQIDADGHIDGLPLRYGRDFTCEVKKPDNAE